MEIELKNISGSITINKHTQRRSLMIRSSSEFFKQPIVYKIEHDCIVFRPATIDDLKQVIPTIRFDSAAFHVVSEYDIKNQKCEFDEYSNTEEVVVYYQ